MKINDKEHYVDIVEKLIVALGFEDIKKCNNDHIQFTAMKDGEKYGFGCMYHIDAISGKTMEEFIQAAAKENVKVPVFVTNSSFSSNAKKAGDAAHVQLWDRNYVDRMCIGVDANLEDEEEKRSSSFPITIVLVAIVLVLLGTAAYMYFMPGLKQASEPTTPVVTEASLQ